MKNFLAPAANFAARKLARQILTLKSHSPKLLFVGGVVGIIGTVVLASRATLKMDEKLEETQEELNRLEDFVKIGYSEEKRQADIRTVYLKTGFEAFKLYGPVVVLGGLSIAALTGSHVILTRRNAALSAAYAILDRSFREYRERVIKDHGTIADAEYRFGTKLELQVPENGEEPILKAIGPVGTSMYARCFDESNKNFRRGGHANQTFLACQQAFANDLLTAKGIVLLNDIYEMLGFSRTPEGALVGWTKFGKGDGYIDFGVLEGDRHNGMRFIMGHEDSVWLDFNVEGPVYMHLDKERS